MEGNQKLRQRMTEAGFTQAGLAEAVNARLRDAGHEGTVSERTVRYWLTGKTLCPYPRQREALEAVFGCTAADLGFTPPRGRGDPATSTEDSVRRRHFLTTTAGTGAAVAPLLARPGVGTSDVIKLQKDLDTMMFLDQRQGGNGSLERRAMSGAGTALELQKRGATQRIRQRLYGVAAGYLATAAWSAIDDRCLDRAQQHLDQALNLAGLANDSSTEFQLWNLRAMLARQRCQYPLAVDAAYAAQSTSVARRDPFFGSLAHARIAVGHSYLGDRKTATRYLGHAEEAFSKIDPPLPRPAWSGFYSGAELYSIGTVVHDRVGDPVTAEAYGHRALASLPEQFRRNRALATTEVALTQLHQKDVDQACSTASEVFALMSGQHLPGRLRSRLGDYYRDLITLAPTNVTAREWGDRYRAEWSRA
ncbi:helix-turn-helix domain-containing protein [Streptomyces odontomachi]|uniref:helix-turn-helix domain-containing protein n=1 Tax=Streptomyces odontomachi TaxID=2944940 RepID=UPI00210AF883|nr:helix-turn-helix transcriptional regulator [Streptomyces sp. ODS25]